ncbi:hypothetical protein D3C73_988880 [compost metagenome]
MGGQAIIHMMHRPDQYRDSLARNKPAYKEYGEYRRKPVQSAQALALRQVCRDEAGKVSAERNNAELVPQAGKPPG